MPSDKYIKTGLGEMAQSLTAFIPFTEDLGLVSEPTRQYTNTYNSMPNESDVVF